MKSPKIESILIAAGLLAALALWYVIFGLEGGNSWLKISFSSVLLASVSLWIMGRKASALFKYRKRHLLIGPGSALLLYGIFWAGKLVLTALFPAARTAIGSVYTAGFCWGLIYLLEKSLTPVIISHALWSVSAFVFFPFA